MTIIDIRTALFETKARSAWSRGVRKYALDLTETLEHAIIGGWMEEDDLNSPNLLRKGMLNGASNWSDYSWGGCSFCYDEDIAKRLCTPSELKKTRNGHRKPNATEDWLDTQARALAQACNLIISIAYNLSK